MEQKLLWWLSRLGLFSFPELAEIDIHIHSYLLPQPRRSIHEWLQIEPARHRRGINGSMGLLSTSGKSWAPEINLQPLIMERKLYDNPSKYC